MRPELGTVMRGSWSRGKDVRQVDDMGGGAYVDVWGNGELVINLSRPGLHPFYYARHNYTLHWDERAWPLHRKLRGLGVKKPDVKELTGGSRLTFDGKRLFVREQPITPPKVFEPVSFEAARDRLGANLIKAVEEIYKGHFGGPVTVLLSGGVDSIAILWALKEIGADVHAVTAGMSEDEFDPKWAKIAADHFDVPWTFLQVPSDDEGLQTVLTHTVATIEQTSFSNVLMGICCTIIRNWMAENGRPVAYLGFYGDLLFGHKLQVTGSFRNLPPEEQTDENWAMRRKEHCWHSKPHTLQLAKNFRIGGETTWRSPFVHHAVSDFLFSMPRSIVPPVMDKRLLYSLMDQHIPLHKAAWFEKKKIGFYTGAGIGKVRLKNPILQDENIRRTYASLKARLT